MAKTIAILATLDTKGAEANFIREQLVALGSKALLVDLGVHGKPGVDPDVPIEVIAGCADTTVEALRRNDDQEEVGRIVAKGASLELQRRVEGGEVDGVIGLGGLRGTSMGTSVMQALPYGLPKVMVSTVASGDTSSYVDIKDITMMFAVGDILGLNSFTRKILANAAGAAHGMAQIELSFDTGSREKPLIGMSNLGVLTQGAMHAIELFEERGYEVVVFHAVGSGGRAMEELMKQGVIGAVFDYAMGEIADEVFEGLRGGGPERLTVAGTLGIPQVLCPGGCEHLGVLVSPPHTIPDRFRDHQSVFHNPVVFVPRLQPDEFVQVAKDIARRLQSTQSKAVMMLPLDGTGRYAMPGGDLRDVEGDRAFFEALRAELPDTIEVIARETHAEDPEFVRECVDRLIGLIEA
ncbi:MAG: Tm-1-like ATP-binding domain-containing protein [Planctomycetota bacterium]